MKKNSKTSDSLVSKQLFSKVGFLEKLLFTKHLSIMLKSGIPLAESVQGIGEQSENSALKSLLSEVYTSIANGQTLSESIAHHPKVFDPLYIGLIRVGEESGTLENSLAELAKELRKEYDFRKKIQGAMLYPAIVIAATTIIGLGVSYFLLPQLASLFTSLDVTLPLSTKILLLFADIFKRFGLFIPFILIGAIVAFRTLIRASFVRPYWDSFILHLPLIGSFLRQAQLTTLFRNLAVMLKTGLPIMTILDIQEQSTSNLVFRGYITRLKKAVEKGTSIETELASGNYTLIPKIASRMVGIGEKSGRLDETCEYLGDFFEEEVDAMSKNLSTILEPILLLGIGLVVAFVAMAIISPIYELTGSIKR